MNAPLRVPTRTRTPLMAYSSSRSYVVSKPIGGASSMCRNIKTLANFAPPATDDEIRASALQFVRKLSGTTKPSQANAAVFDRAVDEVTAVAHHLIHSLHTSAPPRNREAERSKAHQRALPRLGSPGSTRP